MLQLNRKSVMLQLNLSIAVWMGLSKAPMTKNISCIYLKSSAMAAMLQ